MKTPLSLAAAIFAVLLPPAVGAADIISVRRLTLESARDIAQAAVDACRKNGFQVSAVVVDREGYPQMVMRDTLAPRFTVRIAEQKANAVILSGIASGAFRANRSDIREEMNHVDGILVLEGGLPITAAGSTVGAIGVSGAPGGDRDAVCAEAGIEAVRERLEFAD